MPEPCQLTGALYLEEADRGRALPGVLLAHGGAGLDDRAGSRPGGGPPSGTPSWRATSAPPTTGGSRSTGPATRIFPTGSPIGSCEEAFDLACGLYFGEL
jgi:hypothetical protein